MASVQGSLRGAAWSTWREELGPATVGARGSPVIMEDVMKLGKADMTTLGRWPAYDQFTLVTCDRCNRNVKIEAFESHVAMRHGTKSERSAYRQTTAARAAALLSCKVRLTELGSPSPQDQLLERLEEERVLPSSSTSGESTRPPSPQPLVESSTTPTRTPSPPPAPAEREQEATGTAPPTPGEKPVYRGEEEADSTTNNVISIPDSEDMPNIEILSDGMDLLNSKFHSFQSPAPQPPADSSCSSSQPPSSCPSPLPPAPQRHRPAPLLRPPEPMEVCENTQPPVTSQPTHYITVSPLSKGGGSPKKLVIGRLASVQEKRMTGREREYDPNRHCGVWDSEQKRNCTRSLTCKSHSVYLKRKVINRTGPFDELLAQHKAEKESVTVRSSSSAPSEQVDTSSRSLETTSILERRLKLTTGGGQKQELGRVVGNIQVLQPNVKASKDIYCDDSLHYTTDHPKPLAVCTFGGKRIGGLFITDRQRLFTRKVMKLAIGRTVPTVARTQALPYFVNFQSGGVAGGHTIKLASSLQPNQQIVVKEAFKSDLGDFKGGLKFELGSALPRQVHQIVPQGSDGVG